MIKLLIIGAIFVGLIAVYFLIVALMPGFEVPKQKLAGVKPAAGGSGSTLARQDVRFEVKGTTVHAWLYPPENMDKPWACVVMANGTGGTRDMLMERYARRYQAAGVAVLSFDYRYFGASSGEPRQLLWIPYQLEDYTAAVAHARSLDNIDPKRVALWGTSLSGGHVITMAARDGDIACVVAQCPSVDGRASAKYAFKTMGMKHMLKILVHGQRDYIRSLLGLSPHKIPIVGKPGSIGMLTTPGELEFFERFVPETYVNEACARIVIRGDKYRPIKYAKDIRCPVLMQVCEHDEIIPLDAARETEELLGVYAQARYYPIGHFDIYEGEHFEKAAGEQVAFLKKNLKIN